MQEITNFKNSLLIAMPNLMDSGFQQMVAYIYEYNEDGAMAIMINKPLKITLGDLLAHLKIPVKSPDVNTVPILFGGPVSQEQGFILHSTDRDEIAITATREILQEIAEGQGPHDILVALGYVGWSAGELEEEIAHNDWLVAPLSRDIIFRLPFEQRWYAAAALIGVDLNRMSYDAGHT